MPSRLTWVLLVSAACGPSPLPALEPLSAIERAPIDAPTAGSNLREPGPADRLAARGVYHDDYARRVLYTWTTAEQVSALRRDRRLLVAEGGAGVGPSPYLRALAAIVRDQRAGHPLAAILLDDPAMRRRRYAWTSPFATTMGLGPVRYGDALIRVELDPRAVVVRFRPDHREPFAARDLRGAAVPIAELVADPARIGAVYHVRDGQRDDIPFREYVLCNPHAIASWSVATPELRAQVDADIAMLAALADGPLIALPEAALRAPAAPAWASARTESTPLDRWHASLAFDNARYRPSPRNLAAIIAALRGYDSEGPPLIEAAHTAQSSQTSR